MDLIGGIHDSLSLHVLTPFSRLQRSTRPATRPTQQAFNAGLRFRRETANWTNEQRTAWTQERLRTIVRQAYEETPYYRDLYDRRKIDVYADFTFDDFSRFPILNRDQVHEAGPNLLASSVPPDQRRQERTGGSTGAPTVLWLGPNERGWRDSGMERFFETLGVREGSRTALFWGHHLDPKATDSLRDRYHAFVTNVRWFDCFRLSPEILDEYHHELERFRPACIIAYASALGRLAEHIIERGYKPNYPTRCLITGGEKLWSRHRALVDEAFGISVHERYGSRDVGCVGVQLDPASSLDFTIDWSFMMVEPESAQPESPILITKLQADAMPMIRYRIDDVGRFLPGSKPGHPTFALPEVTGRTLDGVHLPDGGWIHGNQLPHMFKDYAVREFMLVQRQDYSVELQVVPQKEFDEGSLLKIEETLKANLPGLPIKIELKEAVARTKSNKWRPVVSEVKVSEVNL